MMMNGVFMLVFGGGMQYMIFNDIITNQDSFESAPNITLSHVSLTMLAGISIGMGLMAIYDQ
jgi:hypothetical protein